MAFSALVGALLLVGRSWPAQAADDEFDKVEIKVHKVAGNIYMLEGEGGNIGVSVGPDGIVIVDDEFAPLAPKIKAALRSVGQDKPLKFVLNTHYHGDHTGGNVVFGESAPIIAHENVRNRLASASKARNGRERPPAPKTALPVITFHDTVSVHINGEEIRAIHFPAGHTDGDSMIYFVGSNVVHTGDDFVTYGYPFIDLAAGGSVKGLVANWDKAFALLPADVKVIPGHGPISTLADVRRFIGMLKDAIAAVSSGMKQGKNLEQLKKDKVLAALEPAWGKGFLKADEFIEIIYKDLGGK
ncbi:MAG TPA: MBL fold metallo-hydrolase [Polyangia bacterium]|nr:MBL fold metallo-hydrolase [Polyangia bacterium]